MHIWRWMPKLHAYIIRPLSITHDGIKFSIFYGKLPRQQFNVWRWRTCNVRIWGSVGPDFPRVWYCCCNKPLNEHATIAASTRWFPRRILLLNGFMFRFHVETLELHAAFRFPWCPDVLSCPCTQLLQWQKQRSNAGIFANCTWKWFEEAFGGLKLTEMAQQQVAHDFRRHHTTTYCN